MKNSIILTLLLVFLNAFILYSCIEAKSNKMIVTGYVKNIPSKKIYLTDAYQWNLFLDSSIYKDNKFQFILDSSKFHEPFLASICFVNYKNEIKQLAVINYKKSNSKDTFATTGFMLSLGNVEIVGDYNDNFHRVSIIPSDENDLYFDPKTEHFAYDKNLGTIKKTIKKHPSSYFLLNQLHSNKHFFSAKQLKEVIGLFNTELQNSTYASNIKQYASFLIENDAPFPNPFLASSKEENVLLFNDKAKVYMLIFWASWCGPCRMEIPDLKAIRKEFPNEMVSMKSISIDESISNWLLAIKQEKMDWQQLLISNEEMLKVKAQFSVNAVPTVIFVDSNKKELKRFVGYDEKNINEYRDFIHHYVSKN